MLDSALAAEGHNNPPPYDPSVVEELDAAGVKYLEAAAEWIENGDLETDEDAQILNDFIAGVKARAKIANEERVKAKKPHDAAGKAVQDAFKPVIDKMDRAKDRVQPLLTTWLNKKDAERKAEIARQRAEAEFAKQEADRKAAEAAARNDISGEIDAEAARKDAEDKAKAVERAAKKTANVSSASGGGRTASLRSEANATVVNVRVLFLRYQERPEVIECLRNLATREARSKGFNAETDTIPGAEISITKKAV